MLFSESVFVAASLITIVFIALLGLYLSIRVFSVMLKRFEKEGQ